MQHDTPAAPHNLRISVHPALGRLPHGNTAAAVKADKARIASASAMGMSAAEMTLAQLAAHVGAGRGFAAYMVDGHRCNDSARAQFLVLDDDLGDPEFEAKVRALNCAAIIGGTSTVGHQRAILPLVEMISDPHVYEALFIRLHYKFGVVVDKAGKVISQPWLGFRAGTMRVIEGAFLTAAEVMSWPAPPEPAPTLRREPTPLTEGQIERHDEYNRMVEQHAPAGKGKRQVFQCINPSHADKHPSARIGDGKDGARLYYCTCGTHSLFTVAGWLNLPSYNQWLRDTYPNEWKAQRKQQHTTRTRSPIARPEPMPAPEPAPMPIKPSTLWQHAPFMVCDLGEYFLIEQQALALGIQDSFTTDQIAAATGKSISTVERWIDKCLNWKAISECPSAKLQGIGNTPTIPCKNADGRDLQGRFASTRYHLTPHAAQEMIARRLPDYVQELMDRGEADVIRRDEATEAGLDDGSAAALELTTRAIAQTNEAFEDSAHIEREAVQKARELLRMAEYDLTPFTPDTDAASVADLRAQLIGVLIATAPNAVWQHGKLMWIAGVKKSSVPALIKKSAYTPAPLPTFADVKIDGDDPHRAVRAACAKHHGAPVAWLDADGEVIGHFSHDVPAGAAGARLNLGKKYILRSQSPAIESAPEPTAQEIEAVEPAPPDPVEVGKVRARRGMLPRLRGCLRARGWHYVGGAFGYWERGNQTSENTCEAMIASLLLDYEWAQKQRAQRQAAESTAFAANAAVALGADVKVLA